MSLFNANGVLYTKIDLSGSSFCPLNKKSEIQISDFVNRTTFVKKGLSFEFRIQIIISLPSRFLAFFAGYYGILALGRCSRNKNVMGLVAMLEKEK